MARWAELRWVSAEAGTAGHHIQATGGAPRRPTQPGPAQVSAAVAAAAATIGAHLSAAHRGDGSRGCGSTPATVPASAPVSAPAPLAAVGGPPGTVTHMAVVVHLDLDAFFASVAQRDDPSLAGRPVAVGDRVVAAASYEARARGVRAAMPMAEARRRCPGLVVVGADIDRYSELSDHVFDLVAATFPGAPLEQVSIDEAFIDLSGHAETPGSAAPLVAALRARIRERLGLPASAGIGTSKVVAKVASAAAKPNGQRVVEPGEEVAFLEGLPVSAIPGVGPRTSARLLALGVRRVADLAVADPGELAGVVGDAAAARLHDVARGRDDSPVQPRPPRASLSTQRAFSPPLRDLADLADVLDQQVVTLAARVADDGRLPSGVTVKLRWTDFTSTSTRHVALQHPGGDPVALAGAARVALEPFTDRVRREGVTLFGVAVTGLGDGGVRQPTVLAPEALSPPTGPLAMDGPRAAMLRAARWCTPGARVAHPTFGAGTVEAVELPEVTVDFGGRVRALDLRHAPLRPARDPD